MRYFSLVSHWVHLISNTSPLMVVTSHSESAGPLDITHFLTILVTSLFLT